VSVPTNPNRQKAQLSGRKKDDSGEKITCHILSVADGCYTLCAVQELWVYLQTQTGKTFQCLEQALIYSPFIRCTLTICKKSSLQFPIVQDNEFISLTLLCFF
jgi:hypothetical protein